MELQGDVGHIESNFVYLEIALVSVEDRSTVCTKCNIASETVVDAPDGTPRRRGSCRILFRSFFEIMLVSVHDSCTICVKCIIGSEIVLYTPDGTPR
jgi:hypothetical protein